MWITLLDLALDFEPRHLAAGETLFSYGDPGFESFLLISGQIDIISADGRPVDSMDWIFPVTFLAVRQLFTANYGTRRPSLQPLPKSGRCRHPRCSACR